MVRVKICGLTRPEDVHLVCASGADFCGVVTEVSGSPRSQSRHQAKLLLAQMTLPPVLVTRQKTLDELVDLIQFLSPATVQLHGDEPPELIQDLRSRVSCAIWKAIPLPPATEPQPLLPALLEKARAFLKAGCDAFLLDTATTQGFGGTGKTPSWELAAELVRRLDFPCFLAGGLTPENVAAAIAIVQPFGVDVSSGVEVAPGIKDPEKVRRFCQEAKRA